MRFLIVAAVLSYAVAAPTPEPGPPVGERFEPTPPTISAGDINGAAIDAQVEAADAQVQITDNVRAAVDVERQVSDKVSELQGQAIAEADEQAWRAVDAVKTAEAQLDGASAAAAPIIAKNLVRGVAAPGVPYGNPAGVPYGNPAGVPYGNPAGVPYGNPAGVSYGNPAGVSYGNPVGYRASLTAQPSAPVPRFVQPAAPAGPVVQATAPVASVVPAPASYSAAPVAPAEQATAPIASVVPAPASYSTAPDASVVQPAAPVDPFVEASAPIAYAAPFEYASPYTGYPGPILDSNPFFNDAYNQGFYSPPLNYGSFW